MKNVDRPNIGGFVFEMDEKNKLIINKSMEFYVFHSKFSY